MTPQTPEALRAFWAKVDTSAGPDACWKWTAGRDRYGYGKFRSAGAHRFSLIAATGRVGKEAMHSCDNRTCVNPKHLRWGTTRENSLDCVAKGRHSHGERHYKAKLAESDVIDIRTLYGMGTTCAKLGAVFGVSEMAVSDIIHRQSWKHLP